MAATIQIHEMSSFTVGADKTSGTVRFKNADNNVVDFNDPLVVPDAGSIWSYTKKLRVYMEAPPDTQINNLRWYTDGGNGFGTGVSAKVKNLGVTWGDNYKTEMGGGSDLFGYTSVSPFDGDGTDTGPFDSGNDDSYFGDLVELQMAVASTASHGSLTPETITFAWDEI